MRHATVDDRTSLVLLLRDAHAAAALPFAFSPAHALALVDRHIAGADMLALVAGSPVRAVLLASAQDHPFAPIRYASETAWWIAPHVRGRFAIRMLDAYEAWARDQGCAFVGMAALASFPRVTALYARRGYRPAETHFLLSL